MTVLEAPIKTRATFADYESLPETNHIIELIDGEIVMNPPLDRHQEIVGLLYLLLGGLLRKRGVLRLSPIGLHIDDLNSFEPDVFWVSRDNPNCYLEANGRYWHGAPDLIVEVLSPSTALVDRGLKFAAYERAGVREYWMVDPDANRLDVYTLTHAEFHLIGDFHAGAVFTSPLIGVVDVAEIFSSVE